MATVSLEEFPTLDKALQKAQKRELKEERQAFGPKRRPHKGFPAAFVPKPYTWKEEGLRFPGRTYRRPSTSARREHQKACANRPVDEIPEDFEEDVEDEDVDEEDLYWLLEKERMKTEVLQQELQQTKEELERTKKELKEAREIMGKTERHRMLMRRQESRKNMVLCYVKLIILLQTFADKFSKDIKVSGFGSGVRKMFEFLSTPVHETHEYGSPFIRDFDISIEASEINFKLVRNYLEALVVNSKGMVKGFPFVFADVSEVHTVANKVRNVSYQKFSMVMFDAKNNISFNVDVSAHQDYLGDDFNVNSLMIGQKGIFGCGENFMDILWDIFHMQAKPLFVDAGLKMVVEKIPRILKLQSSGYKCSIPVPKLEWHFCPITNDEEKSVCVSFSGCKCTKSRPVSINYVPTMVNKDGKVQCYYCRQRFDGFVSDEVRNFRVDLPENPFIFEDNRKEYEELRAKGFLQIQSAYKDAVFLDKKRVGLGDFEEILKWIRGEDVRKPKKRPETWGDLFNHIPYLGQWGFGS